MKKIIIFNQLVILLIFLVYRPSFGKTNLFLAQNNEPKKPVELIDNPVKKKQDKTEFKKRIESVRIQKNVGYVLTGITAIGGTISYFDALSVDTNEFKRKGNVYTNEDAINEHNKKLDAALVFYGFSIVFFVFGLVKGIEYDELRREGKFKKLITSYSIESKKLNIAYKYEF